jgi:hypothetical protein
MMQTDYTEGYSVVVNLDKSLRDFGLMDKSASKTFVQGPGASGAGRDAGKAYHIDIKDLIGGIHGATRAGPVMSDAVVSLRRRVSVPVEASPLPSPGGRRGRLRRDSR